MHKIQKLKPILLVLLLLTGTLTGRSQSFFDDFNGKTLNRKYWKKANAKWGENLSKGTHGGVIPENVFVQDGNLVVRAHGNYYMGPIWGHGEKNRVGGAVYSKRKFASGSYEVRAKICPQPGALSAFWTYYYTNDTVNHEIDFEFPGRNQAPNGPSDSDLSWGLMTNWRGVSTERHRNADRYFGDQTDGQYHLYRFEWHTGGDSSKPRIEWYFDNKLMHVTEEMVPDNASAFWVGIWFPHWIGRPDFDTDYMYVDWVRITEFNEKGDRRR